MTLSRHHKQLNISNILPMDLNFLLFIESVYTCFHEEKDVFPGKHFNLNESELLQSDSFAEILNMCWDESIVDLKQQQKTGNPHSSIHFKQCYSKLFRDNTGSDTSEMVWDAFSLWWWSEYGIKAYMENYTDLFVPKISDQIWEELYKKNIGVSEGNSLYLILLFKQPEKVFPKNTSRLFFTSINKFVTRKELIVKEIVQLFD
ncbi:hypothetical protein E6C60_0563 [Paenibacillus algicola]|uniref:Uncharacterized protein n=1 Tax=Paenibacillus algicola TaxID=2565926 RepID=A0A4P8XFV1_9BACL|nr:hypothetical protein [Paenibacillus algicola]QCT01286.1 hypothetical protein E6C60_0563 [Paenibacillus algicola]